MSQNHSGLRSVTVRAWQNFTTLLSAMNTDWGVHLLEGLCSRVPHLMDREVFALLKGLPTFITDIITYLCNGKRERVIDSAYFLVWETHTCSCPHSLLEPEFLPLPRIPHTTACSRFTVSSTPHTGLCHGTYKPCAIECWVFVTLPRAGTHLCE